jgi:isopentenyldiphosphate isomerase
MMRWLLLAGVYGWLGFTAGYFFRKWLERSWRPRFRAETGAETATAPAARRSAAEEPVEWVDADGRVLETVPRREMRRRNLLHRVTATFVFHPDGRLFVQQRTLAKDVYPGLHDPCVGGTVASGETYAQNAAREVAEELGIRGAPLYFLFGHRFQDASTNSLIRVFACVSAGPVTLQAEEVAAGDWADAAQVEALIGQGRVCPDSAAGWRLYIERFGAGRNFARDIAPGLERVQTA